MGRGKQDLVGARTEERAGRFAHPGRDALDVTRGEIEGVDLIERVARLALALEDQALSVGCPVAFAGAPALDSQPPDARKKIPLLIPARGWR
jgi:hypothetical protein